MTSLPFARDSFVTEPEEIRRLTGQNARILARLERGPATRRELADIACNVTARISDVRRALKAEGRDVQCDEAPGGRSTYFLVRKGA